VTPALKVSLKLSTALSYLLLVLLSLLSVGPFVWLLSTALKSGSENIFAYPPVLLPEHPTLENLTLVFQKIPLWSYFLNSVVITVATIGFNLLCSVLAAYPLARFELPGKNMIFLFILLTMMIPFQVMMVPLYFVCLKLHLTDMSGDIPALLGLILPFGVSGFGIFMMRDAFAKMPLELEQAAILDGCSRWDILRHVFLPLLKPHLATLAIFTLIATWGEFLWPSIVLTKSSLFPLPLGLIYLQSAFSANWRLIAAGTILSVIPVLVTFLILQRQFVSGTLGGAVKG
jgi:putative chitobiose transport system permease protein